MEIHPYAQLYPTMPDAEFRELLESVRKHGLRHPVVVGEDGRLIDGRHRYAACSQAEVPLETDVFAGDDAAVFQYIKDCNYHRRHLTVPQRARIANAEARLNRGDNQYNSEDATHVASSQSKAGHDHEISRRSVQDARLVEDQGTEALKKAVFDQGKIALRDGAKMAKEPAEVQERLAAAENPKTEFKKIAREKRERALAGRIQAAGAALGRRLYGVIYADPPWRLEPWSRDTGMNKAADNHYPTMTLADIKTLQVPAADHAALFLWSTAPMLPEALEVLAAWGFRYASRIVWIKDRVGTGYWVRNRDEILLIGARGDVPAPAPGLQPESAIEAPVGRHSAKPVIFRAIIEGLYPSLPKIELFARTRAAGWDVWGNEAPEAPEGSS